MTPSEFIEVLNRPLAELSHEVEMVPLPGPFNVQVRPPGSKSLTNRALLIAALAQGDSVITGALIDADDAQVMIEALRQLGAAITIEDRSNPWNPDRKGGGSRGDQTNSDTVPASLRIRGAAGRLRGNRTLNLKNAGTATRFLTAAACLADGPVVIDGNERMRQRPIGELVSMLRQLGVTIDELGAPGCVPLRVHPHRIKGGELVVPTTLSSQFVSAIMLIAPMTEIGITLQFQGPITSPSYIQLTDDMMYRALGGMGPEDWRPEGSIEEGRLHLPPCHNYRTPVIDIEPDASGATYFWAAAAISSPSEVIVPRLYRGSSQGDARFASILRSMGAAVSDEWREKGKETPRDRRTPFDPTRDTLVRGTGKLRAITTDLTNMPDAAMTLAAVACFAEGTTTITGLRTLRVKETDRLAAIQTELTKLGVRVEIFKVRSEKPRSSESSSEDADDEGLRITPPPSGIDCSPSAPRIIFDTYDDHRMAMSLALIGLRRPNIVVRDPACVAKTYPTFWAHLSLLYSSAVSGGSLTRSV